jgi:hypothetical protein
MGVGVQGDGATAEEEGMTHDQEKQLESDMGKAFYADVVRLEDEVTVLRAELEKEKDRLARVTTERDEARAAPGESHAEALERTRGQLYLMTKLADDRLIALADVMRATSDDPDFDEVEARCLALVQQADEEDAVGGHRLSEKARMAIAKLLED